MTVVTWLLAGGLVGWGTCFYLGTTHTQAFTFNIGVAIVGAALGGWILGPMLDVQPGFGIFALIVSCVGAAVVLFAVHVFRRTVLS